MGRDDETDDNPRRIFTDGEALLDAMRRGQRFTEELLEENERLRLELVRGESERLKLCSLVEAERSARRQEVEQFRQRIEHLETRFREVESESRDFAERYAGVAQENENLANLYVASFRLHSTLSPAEVTEIICEILVELVGAEEFGILLIDELTSELTPIQVEGPFDHYPAHILVGRGLIGQAVREGKAVYNETGSPGVPVAIVPLQIKGHSVGAIVISKMLRGKTQFGVVAKELLGLLAGHAATALTSSRLYHAVDRKLKTIEAFILMKNEGRGKTDAGTPRQA